MTGQFEITLPLAPGLISIGIDVGGTQWRAAAVDKAGRIVARRSRPWTEVAGSADNFVASLADDVSKLCHDAGIQQCSQVPLGLALPGTLDRDSQTVKRSVNLPFLEGYPVVENLHRRTGCRVLLMTDAEAATWGEYAFQEPKPKRFVHLRIGTGVACGAVLDWHLQQLDSDRTTHLTLLVVDDRPGAPACRCGLIGCLETVASGTALELRTRQLGLTQGIGGLQNAWQSGNLQAQQSIRNAANAIVKALGNLLEHFQPEQISIGGGVVTRLPSLLEEVGTGWRARTPGPAAVSSATLQPALLGDDAGVIGAAQLAAEMARTD